MKARLLVLELWGVGDLAMASDFLREASRKYQTTVLAKPHAAALREKFWPEVELLEFTAPWTPFRGKYRLWNWPWRELARLRRQLRGREFDIAVSARLDPRDHWVMWHSGARRRIGFPRAAGGMFLTDCLGPLQPRAHRYDYWREAAAALGVELPERKGLRREVRGPVRDRVVVHSGAARDPRVWPLERYAEIVRRLKNAGFQVDFLCDERQRPDGFEAGGGTAVVPSSLDDLMGRLEGALLFVGNDSGPGHLAALLGVPTLTVYGPVLPEMYGPLHPLATSVEGSDCRFKPCLDSCRYAENRCMLDIGVDRVWSALQALLEDPEADRE